MSIIHELIKLSHPDLATGGIDRAGILQGSIWPNGSFGMSAKPYQEYTEVDFLEDVAASWESQGLAPLPLSDDVNSHSAPEGKPKRRRGSLGITKLGRKMVENALYMLDRRYGKDRLSFGTLTIPAVSLHEGWKLSSFWHEIVRVFFQRLSRLLGRAGLPRRYVYVTEMQSRRSAREGHPALHLHFVIIGKFSANERVISPGKVLEIWKDVIAIYLPDERFFIKERILEDVRHSVESYMGKYLSKGSGDVEAFQTPNDSVYSLPSSWWGMDNAVRRAVKKATIKDPKILAVVCELFGRPDAQNVFDYVGEYRRENSLGSYLAGIYGKLNEVEWRDMRNLMKG